MKKMAEQPDLEEHVHSMYGSQWSRAGYLMLLEKNQRNLISPRYVKANNFPLIVISYLFLLYLYIYHPDLQESDRDVNT